MRILVIEDEFAALKKMEVMLKPYGQCDSATNGQQARGLFAKAIKEGAPYSLITIDIELPDSSGMELVKYFCAVESKSDKLSSKKIMVTAHSNPDNVLGASKYCDSFISKPVKKDVLKEKLAKLGIMPPNQ